MKNYQVVTNNGLPTAEVHNFVDTIEKAVFVVELSNGVFYIDKSNFLAKTLRSWKLGIGLNEYLSKNKPIKFVERFIMNPTRALRFGGTPEQRVALTQFENGFHDSIYYNYLEKHGPTKAKSSHWLMYGERDFESKTEYVDSWIHQVDYSNLLGGTNGRKSKH